jgi:DnaJ domain
LERVDPMSVAMILSSAALSISLIITAIKLIDGFVRADPRALIRIGTWLLCLIAVASLPCLIVLLIYQQWALAMMLGAGMLIVLTLLNWRSILARTNFQPMWTEAGDAGPVRGGRAQPAPDAELARRAAIVLEDYLAHVGGGQSDARIAGHERTAGVDRQPRSSLLSPEEALDVLGLPHGASASAIRAAHRRLVQLVHPDRGGSNYLAAKINEAKDVLLAEAAARSPRVGTRGKARAASRQATADGD